LTQILYGPILLRTELKKRTDNDPSAQLPEQFIAAMNIIRLGLGDGAENWHYVTM